MNELLETLKAEVVGLTQLMKEKSDKGQSAEVRDLSEKLAQAQKDLAARKTQFEVGTKIDVNKKDLETRLDELYIAKALSRTEDGRFDQAAYDRVAKLKRYAEAVDTIKASGWTADGLTAGTDGAGQDFVPTAFSSTLMEEVWLKLEIANLFKRIAMPAPTYTLPFSPGRIIARASGEQTAVTKDKPATDQIIFNAKKIMSTVEMSDEFEQDSIVPALEFLRKQLIDGFALAQETMCLNGDTGQNAYVVALAGEDCRKLVKGIRADSIASGATHDLAAAVAFNGDGREFRAMRAKMGKYGKAPSDLAYIVNMVTYNEMLKMTGYQALYQYAGAVTTQGELGRIDNIPIIVSELCPMGTTAGGSATDASDVVGGLTAAGKFDAGAGVKTFGTAVLVNKNAYMWGDRKEFTLELVRNGLYGTTNLVGSQRLDFEKVLKSTDKTCASLINISTVA